LGSLPLYIGNGELIKRSVKNKETTLVLYSTSTGQNEIKT